MTDNEETRSRNEILQDNAKLRADNSVLLIQLAQAMQFIDNCGRAIEVTGQLDDNPNLKSVGVQTEGQADTKLLELTNHLEVMFMGAKTSLAFERSIGASRQMYYEARQRAITLEGVLLHIEDTFGIKTTAVRMEIES